MKPMKDSAMEHAIASKKEILGKVKELGTEIELVLDNKVFTAELLWKDAPKTCEAILKALPLEHTTTKDGGIVGSCTGQNVLLLRWPKTFTVTLENCTVYLRNGYCYWKTYEEPARDNRFETSLNELYICGDIYGGGFAGGGGYGYSWGPQGPDPLNEFARIKETRAEVSAAMGQATGRAGAPTRVESKRTFLARRKK